MITSINAIAIRAGEIIYQVYNSDFSVEKKQDESPVTKADLLASEYIVEQLALLFPKIPAISEESEDFSYKKRKSWDRYFLIDPLDGTKSFIKKTGEFTVNIALIENGKPILGVIFAPVTQCLYYADKNGAFKKNLKDAVVHKLPLQKFKGGMYGKIVIVASKSHLNEKTICLINKLKKSFKEVELKQLSSSLKFCLLAEGGVHLYPRIAPTCEWDTAAAQAILEIAGGKLYQYGTKNPLRYNKPNILNPSFIGLCPGFNEDLLL